ncbi:MAG TPA: transglutaminase family protein [Abditibacteriaceae bacterium]
MSLFRVRRTLHLNYSSPVSSCVRQLRVLPATRSTQNVRTVRWKSTPEPESTREWNDDFGNRVLEIKHRRLACDWKFSLEAEVELGESLSSFRETNLPPAGIGAFLLASARCDLAPEIAAIARELASNTARADLPHRICEWTHNALRYDTASGDVGATASQALVRGAGICQDSAHLMIAVCRAANLPARYVAGYLEGEGAMHAWCEVLQNNEWLAFDPTHNRRARDCVFVATGRDYRDCAPLQGRFQGAARVQLRSSCQMQRLGGG